MLPTVYVTANAVVFSVKRKMVLKKLSTQPNASVAANAYSLCSAYHRVSHGKVTINESTA